MLLALSLLKLLGGHQSEKPFLSPHSERAFVEPFSDSAHRWPPAQVTQPLMPELGEDAPENGDDVVVGEDADSPSHQGDAPEPAVLVFPQDPDAFSLLQVQLLGSMG